MWVRLLVVVASYGAVACNGCSNGTNGDPGTVVLHRLNRAEYNNTVRDLLGTEQTPADDFPADDSVGGWDNIASNLSISPLHLELYELAAQALAAEVVTTSVVARVEAEEAAGTDYAGAPYGSAFVLWSNGEMSTGVEAPGDGPYTLRVRVWGDQAGGERVSSTVMVDGRAVLTAEVSADGEREAELLTVDLELTAGPHSVSVSFDNDYWDKDTGADRNLWVDWIELEGPLTGGGAQRDRWVTCDPGAIGDAPCAEIALTALASQAWRRPAIAAEVDALIADVVVPVLEEGGTFDEALEWGVVSVLLSPRFLYRVELDPDPSSDKSHPLDPYEVASRLSYFLWSSMPDEALFAAAAAGELETDEQIAAQVARMLADPKSSALVDNFGGQWLFIRGIDDILKDPAVYPSFDDTLKASMREEMDRFFESFVLTPRDMHELLTATEGEIDEVLAEHYQLTLPGAGWQTVDLASHERGGLFGQAGWLSVESYPTRTSPVIRGKFVLGQLLCDEPLPPPANIPPLEEQADAVTVREQLEQHRADPVCASCHAVMDDIGFGLEHFDAIGRYREEDNGALVDATGVLDGVPFEGSRELTALIAADPRLPGCMVKQAFEYSLGRLVDEETDTPFLADIERQFADGGYTFEALAVALATSDPFLTRRGGE